MALLRIECTSLFDVFAKVIYLFALVSRFVDDFEIKVINVPSYNLGLVYLIYVASKSAYVYTICLVLDK